MKVKGKNYICENYTLKHLTMKRIFWLLAVSALFLCACNKDKDKGDGPLVINPYDLVGVWVCTDNINPAGEHLPNVAALTSMVVSINSLTHYAP